MIGLSQLRRAFRHLTAPAVDKSTQRRIESLGLKLSDVPLSRQELERRGLIKSKEQEREQQYYREQWFAEDAASFRPKGASYSSRHSVSGRLIFRLE
jgi:hypothetical protein